MSNWLTEFTTTDLIAELKSRGVGDKLMPINCSLAERKAAMPFSNQDCLPNVRGGKPC